MYTSAILGAGVLVLPGEAATIAGPASLVAWLVASLMGVPLAFVFAALSSRFPDAGGVSTYTRMAMGDAAGAVVGWWYFVAGSVGQAAVTLTAGHFLVAAFQLPQWWSVMFAAAVLAVGVTANLFAVRTWSGLQIGLAAGVGAILIAVIVSSVPRVDLSALTPVAPHGLAGIGSAIVVLLFAFAGWEAVTHLSAETKTPSRTIPRATVATVAIVTVLYVGVAWAVTATGTYGEPETNRVAIGLILAQAWGWSAIAAMTVAAVVICLGTTNAFIAGVSRLGYAMARDGWAPRAMAYRDGNGTPRVSIAAVAFIAVAGLATAAILDVGAAEIISVSSVLVLTTYAAAMFAAARLLRGGRRVAAGGIGLLMVALVPFAGWMLSIPAVIAVAVFVIGRMRARNTVGGHTQTTVGSALDAPVSARPPT